MADKAADAAETTKTNKAEANKAADEADADTDEADEANEDIEKVSTAEKLPIDNEHVINSVIIYFSFGWRPFSLTKYCAIFSKD